MLRYDIKSGVKKIKTKTFLAFSTFALILGGGAMSLAVLGSAHAATPVYVSSNTISHAGNCAGPDFNTISAAVTAANPGDTVIVCPGAYSESVSINKALTLNGPNVGIIGNSGSRASEATVNDINITASDVTVDGFTFANPGVQMNINGATMLSGVSVKNNIFSGYSGVGMPTYNAGNLLITRNLFKTPLANTEAMQIKADNTTTGGCNGTVVSDNVLTAASNNGGADINFSCTGSGSTGVTVSGNTDTGLADPNFTSFTAFSGVVGDISVTGNHVTGTATSGSPVFFFGGVSGSAVIDNNAMTGSGSSAIAILGGEYTTDGPNSGTFTITSNDLSGNKRGIYVSPIALSSGAQVIAHQNNLSGDTTAGIDNQNSANIVADGTCNWWGDPSGPSSVGSGTGSHVSTNVTYAPWLNSNGGACNSGQVKVQIFKYVDGVQATAGNANSTTFPMVTTFSSPNLGNYTNAPFTLSPSPWGGIGQPYEADFIGSVVGADYIASEVTSGNNVVSTACGNGAPYVLKGYTFGNDLAQAQSATKTGTPHQFTNLQSDYTMIVWNETCPSVIASGHIIKPTAGQHVLGKTLKLKATYTDGDTPNTDDPVQWAVRAGTCAAGVGTVFGNVDGHHDASNWDGNTFTASLNIKNTPAGAYCFVFNPTDDTNQPDVRLTQNFYIGPNNNKDCKNNGWQTLGFTSQKQCTNFVDKHSDNDGDHDGDDNGHFVRPWWFFSRNFDF